MIEARRYQVKVRAAVQMSSIPRSPRNSLRRSTTLTSVRNDVHTEAGVPKKSLTPLPFVAQRSAELGLQLAAPTFGRRCPDKLMEVVLNLLSQCAWTDNAEIKLQIFQHPTVCFLEQARPEI